MLGIAGTVTRLVASEHAFMVPCVCMCPSHAAQQNDHCQCALGSVALALAVFGICRLCPSMWHDSNMHSYVANHISCCQYTPAVSGIACDHSLTSARARTTRAEVCLWLQPLDTSNMDMAKVLKTIMYRFNGIDPVEMNPNFTATVKQIAASGKGVITMCEAGG